MGFDATNADPAVLTLQEAARRSRRGGVPRGVLILHLGAVAALRPHHGRVVRTILTDVAERLEGEVLRLPGGDLALLCRDGRGAPELIGPHAGGPDGLPAVLTRLFGAAARADQALFTVWRLPQQAEHLQDSLVRYASPLPPPPTPVTTGTEAVAGVLAAGAADRPLDARLLRRQTAVRLRTLHGARTFEPCFREVTIALDLIDPALAPPSGVPAGSFLLRHLYGALDAPLLAALCRHMEGGGALDGLLPADDAAVALHVNLSLPGVLSPGFDRLARLCRTAGTRIGVELPFIEAVAAPDAYAEARARLRKAGACLVLDGVCAASLHLTRPAALGADLIKLGWNAALLTQTDDARDALAAAVATIGPARIVLRDADQEGALGWGRAIGITQFQGRIVDAMLAAGRLKACTHAGLCVLRECIDRAVALGAEGRAGCHDRPLLDAGLQPAWRGAHP